MAVAPVPASIELVDLRLTSPIRLKDILRSEEGSWASELHWNFRPSAELLHRNMEARNLPGYVALRGDEVLGYSFYVYEGAKGILGGLYTAPGTGADGTEAAHLLTTVTLESLVHAPQVNRVEAQLIHFGDAQLRPQFEAGGFEVFPRLFLYRELDQDRPTGNIGGESATGLKIAPWSGDFEGIATVIADCYHGHIDSRLNDQYASREGARRFLQNIVTFPGCGTFLPDHSYQALRPSTGSIEGLVMVSEVAAGVAHVTQLCVRDGVRGKGAGRALMTHALDSLARAGFTGASLTVTRANEPAVTLYEKLGFSLLREFDAYARDRAR